MTIKDEINKICKIYSFNVKIYFRSTRSKHNVCGYCDSAGAFIVISNKLKTRKDIISTLFHELGHIHCVNNKLFWKYHKTVTSKSEAIEKIKCAIKAERYVDKWAQNELYKYDSRIKWIPTYFSQSDVNWWKTIWAPSIIQEWQPNYTGKKFYSNVH